MADLLDDVRVAASLPSPAARLAIRRRAWVSRERMARELGVQPLAVARWERGSREPRGELRLRYARLLGLLEEVVNAAQCDGEAAQS
jgi:DNA-binding transcriptional regulator YiaG